MDGKTYYEVLGIPPDASQDEITAAYRERVLETHPDRSDDPDAVDAFTDVTAAKEVLVDETERARYDRLGHHAYLRMTETFSNEIDDANTESDSTATAATDGSTAGKRTHTGRETNRQQETRHTYRSTHDQGGVDSETNGASHHARQRYKRHRNRGKADGDETDWWSRPNPTGQRDTNPGSDPRTEPRADGTQQRATQKSSFQYAVHDWDGDVELTGEYHPLDQSTLLFVCCMTALYPLLVFASITSHFPLVINAVIAVCTLFLVGFLLMLPRIAMVSFGLWSVAGPIGLSQVTSIDPLSTLGIVIVGSFWVPFGYAIGVWLVLRP